MYNSIDLVFFIGFFSAVILIGFLATGRQKNSVNDYFRASNRLPWYVIGSSIVAAGISSEQFVGEMGYAYKLGMPVVNWEWLIFPALTILMWIFIPLYFRNRITTMPEYLERRFGGRTRSLYAWLTVASYVLVNFSLVFYTGGFALERMWGIDRFVAVWILALATGLYTVYGGLKAVAWTSSLQCGMLLGGGLLVFFLGMSKIDWDFAAVLGTGQRAHLMTSSEHAEVPWTAFVILALSTNVWYYATNQYINQRCLAAKNEWHAKMGVLFAGALQLLMPLATCFPGMIYRVFNPNLTNADAAYPEVVAWAVPTGLRGLVAAAIVGAIMSTISGLVNSTSTIITLDIFGRWKGRTWSEERLVRVGRWSGSIALLIGAIIAPVVMNWESLFRYAQDIWAPMAAPAVVVFICGALVRSSTERGALACIWLAILTVPLTLTKAVLADQGIHFLPPNLENSLVFAGAISLISWILMGTLLGKKSLAKEMMFALPGCIVALGIATLSSTLTAVLVAMTVIMVIIQSLLTRRTKTEAMWDMTMLSSGEGFAGSATPWIWWSLVSSCFAGVYWFFW